MLVLELLVHDSLHEAALTDARIANNDQLEEVVLVGNSLVFKHFERNGFEILYVALLHLQTPHKTCTAPP